MLELINIRKEYQSPVEKRSVVVLDDINLKVSKGRSVAIVGPSGSGKSTLLNIIGALDRPTSGQVVLWQRYRHVVGVRILNLRSMRE